MRSYESGAGMLNNPDRPIETLEDIVEGLEIVANYQRHSIDMDPMGRAKPALDNLKDRLKAAVTKFGGIQDVYTQLKSQDPEGLLPAVLNDVDTSWLE